MLRDLFYRLFKRSKIQSFETRIAKLEHIYSNLSTISIESLEKTNDNLVLIQELQQELSDLRIYVKTMYDYIIEEKWDTKH